ncbi:MAG: hypothetical protein COA61_006680 [Zetaproteobacteria bacterium]|nr:hypothetical protein [Zetaproteobacteria bacterium]
MKTDEREESISSLEMVRNASLKVSEDFFQWKWVIIALHNALQGFMVLSLRNGNNFRVMPDKLARKCYEAHRANKPWPKERLDSFLNLYKKIKNDEYMKPFIYSKSLPETENNDWCVNKLIELRNKFIHFVPQGWSLNVSGLPHICLTIIEIMKFLAWESGNIFWHNDRLKDKSRSILNECEDSFRRIKEAYESNS